MNVNAILYSVLKNPVLVRLVKLIGFGAVALAARAVIDQLPGMSLPELAVPALVAVLGALEKWSQGQIR